MKAEGHWVRRAHTRVRGGSCCRSPTALRAMSCVHTEGGGTQQTRHGAAAVLQNAHKAKTKRAWSRPAHRGDHLVHILPAHHPLLRDIPQPHLRASGGAAAQEAAGARRQGQAFGEGREGPARRAPSLRSVP